MESNTIGILNGNEDINNNIKMADILCTKTWKSWEKILSKEKKDKKLLKNFYKQ